MESQLETGGSTSLFHNVSESLTKTKTDEGDTLEQWRKKMLKGKELSCWHPDDWKVAQQVTSLLRVIRNVTHLSWFPIAARLSALSIPLHQSLLLESGTATLQAVSPDPLARCLTAPLLYILPQACVSSVWLPCYSTVWALLGACGGGRRGEEGRRGWRWCVELVCCALPVKQSNTQTSRMKLEVLSGLSERDRLPRPRNCRFWLRRSNDFIIIIIMTYFFNPSAAPVPDVHHARML